MIWVKLIYWCRKAFTPTAPILSAPLSRNQLTTHADVVKETVARKTMVLGLQHYSRRDLEKVQAAGEKLQIQVLGLAVIANDVTPDLAKATIDSIIVLGALRASRAVKAVLADKIR